MADERVWKKWLGKDDRGSAVAARPDERKKRCRVSCIKAESNEMTTVRKEQKGKNGK